MYHTLALWWFPRPRPTRGCWLPSDGEAGTVRRGWTLCTSRSDCLTTRSWEKRAVNPFVGAKAERVGPYSGTDPTQPFWTLESECVCVWFVFCVDDMPFFLRLDAIRAEMGDETRVCGCVFLFLNSNAALPPKKPVSHYWALLREVFNKAVLCDKLLLSSMDPLTYWAADAH